MATKFLIIRFSSIGDIVLTTPVVRCLRKKFPDAQIHYLTKNSFASILLTNPYLNKVHVLKDDLDALSEELKSENFDYIIDLHNNLRTLRIKQALKNTKSFSFDKLNIQKWVLVNFKVNTMPDKHIVDRYMETIKSLGVVNDGLGLDYFIHDKDVVSQNDIPISHLHGYIGVVIGAAHNTKKLPVHKLKDLCSKINHPIILLGGKQDYADAIQISSSDPVKIYNACGKYNLNESADLIRRAKLIISHDTGLMHIAAAFKKNIISVWGNTVPSFGMYPYQTQYEIFDVKKLWCRPCSKIGYDKCPLGHFKCMEGISIDLIVDHANIFLRK
ncbi:MAG TPA: glycosyltransferase family 9 protein [Chitinophagaceae bacterium]|nr:glycosyltransferase family 9 protein [Chitinophagaceae bacterium]